MTSTSLGGGEHQSLDPQGQRSVCGTIKAQRRLLPIYPARGPLLQEIKSNDSCVVVGETGSGKTTQIPQVGIDWSPVVFWTGGSGSFKLL